MAAVGLSMPPESRAQQRYVIMIDVQIDDPIHTREAISALHAYCCYSTRREVSAGGRTIIGSYRVSHW